TPGPWPTQEEARLGRLRTDALAIDSVDPATGAARTLYTARGYTLHLAGETEREIVVYRVAFEGAELVAIDRESARARLVTAPAPYARDFSVSRSAIVMSNRAGGAWTVERIDLTTGANERLVSAAERAPVPRVGANGEVHWGEAAALEEALDEKRR